MTNDYYQLILMLAVAAASGLVGVYAMMRKMTLASDAMSHIALPGLGVALLLKINPLIGGAIALFLGAIIIWAIEKRTMISTETVIGVMFSASLAIGSLLTPEEELIEALFGSAGVVDFNFLVAGLFLSSLVILFILMNKERLTLALISRELATASGVNVSRMNLWFLLIFALNVILGLQFLGVLLMGSLIIVPAVAARNLGTSLGNTLFISFVVALLSVGGGYLLSQNYAIETGPAVIVVATALFFLSFLKKAVRM